MDASLLVSSQCKLRQCSHCTGNTAFWCNSCHQDFCSHCKEEHVIDFDTKDHDVVAYRETRSLLPTNETCTKHSNSAYEKFCLTCQVPFCLQCSDHKPHSQQDIKHAYEEMRQETRQIISKIRSETLYIGRVYQTELKCDVESDVLRCREEMIRCQKKMSIKGQELKTCIDPSLNDFGSRCKELNGMKEPIIKMERHLRKIRKYEQILEQSANIPIFFLKIVKRNSFSDTTRNISAKLSTKFLVRFLGNIRTSERQKRQVDKNRFLTIMSRPVVEKYLETGDLSCRHFSVYSSERFWISDQEKIVLTNFSGSIFQSVSDPYSPPFLLNFLNIGLHTVTSDNDLIYIDEESNIAKFSTEDMLKSILIRKSDLSKQPVCVYISISTGDLLVGIIKTNSAPGVVIRYKNIGTEIETNSQIQFDDKCQMLFSCPIYLTENNNGDIVVSDAFLAVVVTDREGRHRFTYKGAPFVKTFSPLGICTDLLSNILVCDDNNKYIHIIDLNGQLMKFLVLKYRDTFSPRCVRYDLPTNRLWIGSACHNTIAICKYIARNEFLQGIRTSEKELEQEIGEGNKDDYKSNVENIETAEKEIQAINMAIARRNTPHIIFFHK